MTQSTHTLSIDIGGTGLKASVLDQDGKMVVDRVRVSTPKPCPPAVMVETLSALVEPLPAFDRVSVGFPGVVRKGVILTAPNLGTPDWQGHNLGASLGKALGDKPIKIINDADMQGLAVVKGQGLEMVITLGTGFGTGIYIDGKLGPHLEMAHHPFRDGQTYDKLLGDASYKALGMEPWKALVVEAISNMRVLTNFDALYVGGGNARHFAPGELGDDVHLVDNSAGILGGIMIWNA